MVETIARVNATVGWVSNYVFLILSFITIIVGCACLWRAFDRIHPTYLDGNLLRQAQYEACSFLFYWIILFFCVWHMKVGKSYAALRLIAMGILLYITVFGTYVNFTILNNLRVVSQRKSWFMPITGEGPVDGRDWRLWLAGLILGWIGLFLGLFATTSHQFLVSFRGGFLSIGLWLLALILIIPGNIVLWSNSAAPTYDEGAAASGTWYSSPAGYPLENRTFMITTVVMVQWLVLTLGIFCNQSDLLAASTFMFGVASLWIPIWYFYIQRFTPDDPNYIWAGAILDWVAAACMAAAAVFADNVADTQKGLGAVPRAEAAV
jgi:hypothetical protein